ncbi:MAG TPA: PP2C family protein-serine/threonine phosphatase [Bacillales bacterium]|nr:PP2C family protein-serine/threonine phosphatase [Bacillales bacterium]
MAEREGEKTVQGREALFKHYEKIIKDYLMSKDESALYQGQQFSRELLEQQISPEDVLSLHIQAVRNIFRFLPEQLNDTFDFLMEVMVAYGLAYREHQSLRNKQRQLDTDIEVAASMQQTFLRGELPQSEVLDIGALSQPARKMSGDYYHFVQDDHDCISIAIADVIGKGIPAALSMSMIKYSMDSVPEQRMQPGAILENLNRVVEQNVRSDMFITMMYGIYDPRVHRFYYSGAGHEPGFFYSAKKDEFQELAAKGLVLGASNDTKYREFEKSVEVGDMIVLLSDGVTECRTEKGFIEREEIVDLIRQNFHLKAQKIVERVYAELERVQDFQLRDDFTLIILRRKV